MHLSYSSLSLFFAFSLIFTVTSSLSLTLINVSPLTWHHVIRLGGFLLSTSMCVSMYGTKQRSTSAWPVPATADGTTSEIPCDEQWTPLFSDDHYGTWLQVMQHGDWTWEESIFVFNRVIIQITLSFCHVACQLNAQLFFDLFISYKWTTSNFPSWKNTAATDRLIRQRSTCRMLQSFCSVPQCRQLGSDQILCSRTLVRRNSSHCTTWRKFSGAFYT